MKRSTFLLGLILAASQIAFGQTETSYDFKTKTLSEITYVDYGKSAVFKIKNVNRFLYDVKIEAKQTSFYLESKPFLNIETQISSFISKIDFDIKIEESQKISNNKSNNKNDDEENNYLEIIKELYTKSFNVYKSFKKVEEAKVLKNRLISISQTEDLTYEKSKEKVNELLKIFPFNNYLENLTVSFESDYKEFINAYKLYLNNAIVKKKFNNDEASIKGSVNDVMHEVDLIKSTFDNTDYNKIFLDIYKLLDDLKNENSFLVVSDPVQAEKDIITFNVKITPRKEFINTVNPESRDFSITIPVIGGVKIDFSTGSFITTGLHNRKYSLYPSNADSIVIIRKNKNSSLAQISFGALMHISPRTIDYRKLGFSFGFGLNSSDISNSNVFIGLSGIIGSQERFIASFGLSLTRVDCLKGDYSLNKEYLKTIVSSELTEKTTRAGLFISFTYNLTNIKKE